MFKKILVSLFLITAGALTAGMISYAWTEPSGIPPNGSISALSGILQSGNLAIGGVIHAKDFIIDYLLPGQSATSTYSIGNNLDKDGDRYTTNQGDCNDSDPAIYPGASPRFDSGKDYDCNGVNEYTVKVTREVDGESIDSFCTQNGKRAGKAVGAQAFVADVNGTVLKAFNPVNIYYTKFICLKNLTNIYFSKNLEYIYLLTSYNQPKNPATYTWSYGWGWIPDLLGPCNVDWYTPSYNQYYQSSVTNNFGYWIIQCN